MAAILWLVGGVLLAAGEALSGDLFLLMLAGGALGTAGISAVTDMPVWADALVFAATSAVLLVGLRPILLRRYGTPPPLTTGVAALTGKSALVLEEVDAHAGRIKLDGDVWTARAVDASESFPVGSTVTVLEIDGATAVVWKGL